MTMNCAGWEAKLNAELDGELPTGDRAPLDAHLAACADCRRTRDALRLQARDLDAAFGPVRAETDALAGRIAAAVRAEPRRRPPGRLVSLAAAAAAGFLLAFLIYRRPAPPGAPEAFLSVATGPVESLRGGSWKALSPGAGVAAGDQIRTAPLAKCEIRTSDGSVIRLNEATEIELKGARAVHLKEGQIYAQVAPKKDPWKFSTDQCFFQSAEGALDLTHDPPEAMMKKFDPPRPVTSLAVIEGRATLTGGVAEQEVLPETACNVVQRTPEPAVGIDPLLRSRWVHDLLKARRKDDPEVARRVTLLLARLGRTKTPELFEQEIRSLGDRAVPALLSIATRPPPELSAYDRRAAAGILADLAGPPEVPSLVPLAGDPDGEVAEAAAKALSRITGKRMQGGDAWRRWERDHGAPWK
jgi:hypothetical protein